jgi:hypothetical protein
MNVSIAVLLYLEALFLIKGYGIRPGARRFQDHPGIFFQACLTQKVLDDPGADS